DSQIDVPAKRYRYTGMERDEETGLGYHTARYYAPWLGRWTASDPIGLGGGLNRFAYARNPLRSIDPRGTQEEAVWVDDDGPARVIVVESSEPDLLEKYEQFIEGMTSSEDAGSHERTFRDKLNYFREVGQ